MESPNLNGWFLKETPWMFSFSAHCRQAFKHFKLTLSLCLKKKKKKRLLHWELVWNFAKDNCGAKEGNGSAFFCNTPLTVHRCIACIWAPWDSHTFSPGGQPLVQTWQFPCSNKHEDATLSLFKIFLWFWALLQEC